MLHGKGDQFWMTQTYHDKRAKALEDRTKYSDELLDQLDVLDDQSLGGGRTNPDSYEIKQFPFPMDTSIKSKKKMDLREADPRIGKP